MAATKARTPLFQFSLGELFSTMAMYGVCAAVTGFLMRSEPLTPQTARSVTFVAILLAWLWIIPGLPFAIGNLWKRAPDTREPRRWWAYCLALPCGFGVALDWCFVFSESGSLALLCILPLSTALATPLLVPFTFLIYAGWHEDTPFVIFRLFALVRFFCVIFLFVSG